MPKPTAVLYGLCREGLNFYDIPKNNDMKQKNDSGKVGRVRITGGTMSTQQLLMELEWLVPGHNQWDITPVGLDAFRVVFPSKADLVRQRRLKPVDVEGTSITMHFEDWSSRRLDKYGIFDLWIRVLGCPDTLCRDYLGLFAVGSLVGKTKEIDMKFTREHYIARMRIDCVNPQLIPRYLDHFYDGEGFGIEIHIEALDGSVVPAGYADEEDDKADEDATKETDKSHDMEDHDKNKNSDVTVHKDLDLEQQQKDSSKSEDMVDAAANVQLCSGGDYCDSSLSPCIASLPPGSMSAPSSLLSLMVEEDEEEQPRCDINTQVSLPYDQNTEVSHVADSFESHHVEQVHHLSGTFVLQSGAVGGDDPSPIHTSISHPSDELSASPCTPQGKPGVCIASLQSSPASIRDVPIRDGSDSTRGTGVFLGGRYSKQKVIDYGGIPEATVLGVRTSERIKAQPNADATQL
jgi:hypothetical protein